MTLDVVCKCWVFSSFWSTSLFFTFGSRVHGVLPVKIWMIVGQFLKEDPGLGNEEGEYEFG